MYISPMLTLKEGRETTITRQMYMLGLLDRDSRLVYFELTSSPQPRFILPIIYRHTLDGSLILTDSWPVYTDMNAQNLDFARRSQPGHSVTFIEPSAKQQLLSTFGGGIEEFWPRARLVMRDVRAFRK